MHRLGTNFLLLWLLFHKIFSFSFDRGGPSVSWGSLGWQETYYVAKDASFVAPACRPPECWVDTREPRHMMFSVVFLFLKMWSIGYKMLRWRERFRSRRQRAAGQVLMRPRVMWGPNRNLRVVSQILKMDLSLAPGYPSRRLKQESTGEPPGGHGDPEYLSAPLVLSLVFFVPGKPGALRSSAIPAAPRGQVGTGTRSRLKAMAKKKNSPR